MTEQEIKKISKAVEPDLIRIRRKLHETPELSMKEYRTSEIIAEELEKIDGIQVYRNLGGGTGVMGILKGKKPGKCILLRADIDALPVEENNSLPFKSQNAGCMHACGHDSHASWVIGSAMILSRMADELPGTVKFIFQPGEEIGGGALEMIEEDHILDGVDYAFAAHAWPSISSGKIGIARKYAFGCPGGFEIKVKGKGGHGSWPHLAVNPIMIASEICMTLPRILSERIDAVEPRVISIGAIHAGKPGVGNIIPDICTMNGTIRAVKGDVMGQLEEEIENVVKHCSMMYGAEYEFHSHLIAHGVKNDPALVKICQKTAEKIVGEGNSYIIEEDNLGGENFAEYSARVRAAYFFVGIKNEEITPEFALHSPEFMLDESVLKNAAAVFASLVLRMNRTE